MADIGHFIGKAEQCLRLGVRKMVIEQTVVGPNELLCIAELEAQRSRPLDCRADLLASGALFVNKGLVQRDLEGKLATLFLRRIWKMFDLPEALP